MTHSKCNWKVKFLNRESNPCLTDSYNGFPFRQNFSIKPKCNFTFLLHIKSSLQQPTFNFSRENMCHIPFPINCIQPKNMYAPSTQTRATYPRFYQTARNTNPNNALTPNQLSTLFVNNETSTYYSTNQYVCKTNNQLIFWNQKIILFSYDTFKV